MTYSISTSDKPTAWVNFLTWSEDQALMRCGGNEWHYNIDTVLDEVIAEQLATFGGKDDPDNNLLHFSTLEGKILFQMVWG
jgi:hypothetical protein